MEKGLCEWKETLQKLPEGAGHMANIGERLCNKWAERWRKLFLAQEHAEVDLAHRITSKAVRSQAAHAQKCYGSGTATHTHMQIRRNITSESMW